MTKDQRCAVCELTHNDVIPGGYHHRFIPEQPAAEADVTKWRRIAGNAEEARHVLVECLVDAAFDNARLREACTEALAFIKSETRSGMSMSEEQGICDLLADALEGRDG